jgi:hypothetical protein
MHHLLKFANKRSKKGVEAEMVEISEGQKRIREGQKEVREKSEKIRKELRVIKRGN